jgi:phage tail-like protein
MARAQRDDMLQVSRFWVAVADQTSSRLSTGARNGDVAGFRTCTSPELTIGPKTPYREGQYLYGEFLPGLPTFNTITLARGVMRGDGSMWSWAKDTAEGGDTREGVTIYHYHRDALAPRALLTAVREGNNRVAIDVLQSTAARLIKLYRAQPARYKPASDFDATASQISVAELDLNYQSFDEEHLRAA